MDFFEELLQKPVGPRQVGGVMRGVVKENWDEKNPGKIRVELYLGEKGKLLSDWIPVAVPYAAEKAGMYFLPEVGTEVLVAFENGDPDCPVVLGSLWNSKTPLPEATAKKENDRKCLRTKAGHEISFDETKDKAVLRIETPGGLRLSLEDENEVITLQNKAGDTLLRISGKDGELCLDAKKKLELKVGGKALLSMESDKVTLSAGTLSAEGKQSLKLKGQSAEFKANMLNVKADASLKLEAGGVAELKGAMVKVN